MAPSWNNLPSDPWLKILSYLDYLDLVRCSQVDSRLCELSNHNSHWRRLCKKYWLTSECPDGISWKEYFCFWFKDFGKYVHCYAKIASAWRKIDGYMKDNCNTIYESMRHGITEAILDRMEMKLGLKLPDDFRCSFRIHNGQRFWTPGVLGSVATSNHFRSDFLQPIPSCIKSFKKDVASLRITWCCNTGKSVNIALDNVRGLAKGMIYQSSVNLGDVFILANSFSQWLTTYADKLASNQFPLLNERPFRFEHDPSWICTTNYIHVTVATCFLPELSSINPPTFVHAYRITMTMPVDAPVSAACQLETRHWMIVDEDGAEETVVGPGVVGEFPIMRPGHVFSWISSTMFKTTHGSMHGYFTMRKLKSGEEVEVICPRFHMSCLPYMSIEKE